jgi:hypothetical protein
MRMEEFEYCSLFKQLNERQKKNLMMLCIENNCTFKTLICLFLTGDVGISENFTLKFII